MKQSKLVLMMKCFVYKSIKKADSYIYINEKDNFQRIPKQLLLLFGKLEFTFEFELTIDRKLAIADAKQVMQSLSEQGYYLQMPSKNNLPI
ncbi:MAG: YcgL domain-containing protein [Gammaproteobacteria bacterium]